MREKACCLRFLSHFECPSGPEKLEKIVGEADQFPFRAHLLQPTQQEPTEPAPLFNLSEHRFHDCLTHPVHLASRFRFQLLPHLLQYPTLWLVPCRTGIARSLAPTTLLSSRSHV